MVDVGVDQAPHAGVERLDVLRTAATQLFQRRQLADDLALAHDLGVQRLDAADLAGLERAQLGVVAGVTQPNAAIMGLHTALGFELVGVYRKVGYKFGRWHDVAWLSLALQPHPAEPASPRPLGALPADAVTDALAQGAALLRA